MTKNEALFYCNQWAHGGAYRLSEHAAAIDFIHYCYSDGVEIIDRKIDVDTARHLDNELSDVESDDWIREVLIGLGAEEGK